MSSTVTANLVGLANENGIIGAFKHYGFDKTLSACGQN
jgi:hypothetical protein